MTGFLSQSLSDTDFQRIVDIAAVEAGLSIPASKKSLVQSRVSRRMRTLGVSNCGEYLSSLTGNVEETGELISVLTTNVSHFFRERHHFEFIRKTLLSEPSLGRLNFWSAGCSNGQEPYSLAIEILKSVPDAHMRGIRIFASDIDHQVLAKAASGVYQENEVGGVDAADLKRFFDHDEKTYTVKSEVRKLVQFDRLNLNSAQWSAPGPFDVILCRNVVIYFNAETQQSLWPRFGRLLKPSGSLLLGHSERVHPLAESGFENIGITTYRKL